MLILHCHHPRFEPSSSTMKFAECPSRPLFPFNVHGGMDLISRMSRPLTGSASPPCASFPPRVHEPFTHFICFYLSSVVLDMFSRHLPSLAWFSLRNHLSVEGSGKLNHEPFDMVDKFRYPLKSANLLHALLFRNARQSDQTLPESGVVSHTRRFYKHTIDQPGSHFPYNVEPARKRFLKTCSRFSYTTVFQAEVQPLKATRQNTDDASLMRICP
ncbi:hypothetical protein BJX62DRAFT_4773 [Aspergillus germanicus]